MEVPGLGEVTKDVADSLGLPKAQGALVSSVEPGGPADKAGVQPGDIILKFNGHSVDTATDLPRMVGDTKPGTKTTTTVLPPNCQFEIEDIENDWLFEKSSFDFIFGRELLLSITDWPHATSTDRSLPSGR